MPLPAIFSTIEGNRFTWSRPLLPATIVNGPNRFIVNVKLDGGTVECHCPTTGSIGGWVLDGLPALISGPFETAGRRTRYTLEAVGVELLDGSRTWVGVNQNAANRYVEAALGGRLLDDLLGDDAGLPVANEKTLGNSRIDFKVGGTYLEVKSS